MSKEIFTCTIDSLSYGVFGVARTTEGVVFVSGVSPGDVARVRIIAEKRGYREAEVVEILESSPVRRIPPCRFLPACGGCTWQHVSYPAQLEAKEAILREALLRTGGLDPQSLEIRPILPSSEWAYRHRITLRVDGEQRLGFYRHRSHQLVEIDDCQIAGDTVNAHLAAAREWLRGISTTVRRLEIASTAATDAVFVANAEGSFRHDGEYHERFLHRHPTVRGIVLFGKGWRRSFGDPEIELDLGEGLSLRTRGGFTQVNSAGNRKLIEIVLGLGEPVSEDRVLDLYCGAGNLTLPLARRVREAVGVEIDPQSIGDARRNADRAGLRNCRFLQQGAAAATRAFLAERERFSLAVVEPLAKLRPERLLYVSCNPVTLARDLRALVATGFRLGPIQPIDLFPQTYHLETVVLLR